MRKKLNKVLAVTLSMAVSLPSAPVYAGQPADSKGDVTESETESEAASEQEENQKYLSGSISYSICSGSIG